MSEVFNPSFGDSNKKKLGFSLEETLEKCTFNTMTCNINDFEW